MAATLDLLFRALRVRGFRNPGRAPLRVPWLLVPGGVLRLVPADVGGRDRGFHLPNLAVAAVALPARRDIHHLVRRDIRHLAQRDIRHLGYWGTLQDLFPPAVPLWVQSREQLFLATWLGIPECSPECSALLLLAG